ncbi:hypothetical protein HG536_0F00720 [Torulaspora globosa]|uniref:Protein ILM1 n=1 Tax=Torulaspora globosa TaxID=48254 RepID=A0A7G3ZJR1_9SACH|nr:uncharacterized protein HG536_0F00720 [Torulaspora globosa]QLL33747.1 hypothetical protein HG536_0F00720 [Torulaspora globosa]
MAAISSVNGLFFRVTFLFSLAFFCFKNVNSVLQNSYMLVFTQAMNLPGLAISQYSAQLGLFGILFLFASISDLIPLLENNKKYFHSIVPLRLTIFFALTACSYLWESNLYLHNNAVFTYCFIEVWVNFVILGALREERNEELKSQNRYSNDAAMEDELEDENSNIVLTSAQEIEQIEELPGDSNN